ncbi:MAG TPA: beta-ketoacyl synthase N-terminal-like domain-containing protein [Streptosporangiaceae bacterium]|nr:beta-ketoacyl synthase N-terminal-like domain-containing protein [Streptosporangiaceae bacterium]
MLAQAVQRWPIAGLGAIASNASGAAPLFEALCAGHSGLSPLYGFDAGRFRTRHAYEIDDRPAGADVPGRATQWLCEAVAEAVHDAGIGADLSGIPVLIGTGLRELRSIEMRWTDAADFPLSRLHFGPALRERFGAETTYTVSNACSASLYTLGMGADLLAGGAGDTVIIAGTDSISMSMFGLMDRVQPGAVDRVRPFDRNRRGVLMGDGAAAVVLRRDGPARAWLRSVALNCDARSETAPDLAGITAAIADAHTRAGIEPADVDVVFAHGTGTALNDEAEAAALAKTFTGTGARPLVTAIKSMTGHTSGASGLMSLVVAAQALGTGRIPPIAGLTDPAGEAQDLRLVTSLELCPDAVLAQIQAFGFGGVNAVAIVEKGDR